MKNNGFLNEMDAPTEGSLAPALAGASAAMSGARAAYDHIDAADSAGLPRLCDGLAARWCESFGVDRAIARSRLAAAILGAVTSDRVDLAGPAAVDDWLHGLARKAIEDWFAACGVSAGGRNFDRVRHAFLVANRDGRWSESFLAADVDQEALRRVLSAGVIAATPARAYTSMVRQTL